MSIEHEHMMETESEWHNQQKMIRSILESGMQSYADGLENSHEAFEKSEHRLCCIDEGVPQGDMRSAGSGILSEGEDRSEMIAKLKAAGVKEVTSHAGCGAAGLYREKNGLQDKTIDEVAIEGAKKMAEELGVPYAGHVTELQRPKEFHNARVVYVDGTGSFNPANCKDLPPGFVVSRKFMSEAQAITETTIAASIAFGDHGFGKKFTKDDPLIVVLIGDDLQHEQTQLQEAFKDKQVKIEQWIPEFLKQAEQPEYKMAA